MKTSRISRIIRLLTTLQSGKDCRIAELADMLGKSRRTVYRDLEELRSAGVPCSCDGGAGHYGIASSFRLVPSALTREEALGLLLLAYKARNYLNIPFRDAVLRAALKIESDLPANTKQYCNAALRHISIRQAPQATTRLLDGMFTTLQQAIQEKRAIGISCEEPLENGNSFLEVRPLHLLYGDGSWHLVAESAKGTRVLKLHRIRHIELLPARFEQEKQFDLQECLGRAWRLVREGTLYHVRLRFAPEVAAEVTGTRWQETQKAAFGEDGSAVLEFRVDGLNEIIWWVLSYGDKVTVLSPRILRDRVVDIAQNMVRVNHQESAETIPSSR